MNNTCLFVSHRATDPNRNLSPSPTCNPGFTHQRHLAFRRHGDVARDAGRAASVPDTRGRVPAPAARGRVRLRMRDFAATLHDDEVLAVFVSVDAAV